LSIEKNMEDPGAEPEQKRIKRIAEHIEDEIVRAQHLPLEELIRHKAFMVRLLQFLSIEEAYAASLASRRIYEWFQQNDIWYALAQRWLTSERLAQCEAWVEQVRPKGKRINYLWLLLGDHAEQRLARGHYSLFRIKGYRLDVGALYKRDGWMIVAFGYTSSATLANIPRNHDTPLTDMGIGTGSSAITTWTLGQAVYFVLLRNTGAKIAFGDMSKSYIRSKLGN
jgi:hypothetical protein